MKVKQGGTKIFCPYCQEVTVGGCVSLSSLEERAGQRLYRSDHADVQWFRRGRECKSCRQYYITAELDEDFVGELCKLRDALGEIKKNAERYVNESDKATESLKNLTASLEALRALDIYQKQV